VASGEEESVMVSSPPCPFCAIVSGTAPASIVARFDAAIAFFPEGPATVGHTLVVPMEHIQDVWSLDTKTARSLSEATLKVAHAVTRVVRPEGLSIIQSNGEAATQTVPHLHIHVLPRWGADCIGPNWPKRPAADLETLERALTAIRSEFGGRA
jgi:histidine triad (HIT) family protein